MIVSILVAALAAAADWTAVATERPRLEALAKPLVMIALIGFAVTSDFAPSSVRTWILVALVLGLVGDLALLPRIDRFIVGLGSFLVGHVAYVIAFVLMWEATPWLIVGALGSCGLVAVYGRSIERSIRESSLRLPVVAYMAVTCVVIVAGAGTGQWLIVGGALAFAVSDGLLGSNRFVDPQPQQRWIVHALYHSGQAAIVIGAATLT